MNITRAEGLACLRAAERIAEGEDWAGVIPSCWRAYNTLLDMGWIDSYIYSDDHALLALIFAATVAGVV